MNKITHKLLLCCFALLLTACGGGGKQGPTEPLLDPTSPESLRAMVPNLIAHTNWDLTGDLRWGYVFTDPRKAPLVKLSEELTRLGFTEVELTQTIGTKSEWRLHSEKIDRLPTAEKLVAEGAEMHQLVNQCQVLHFVEVKVRPIEDEKPENIYQNGWWTYYSEHEGEPSSVSLNLALKEGAPYLDFPSLLITGIEYPADDEVPVEERLKEIHQLRSDRFTHLKLFAHSIEAGAKISDGRETHYIYVSDTTGLQELMRKFYEQNFPEQKYHLEIIGNSGWDVYLRDLFPNTLVINEYEEELKELKLWPWVEDSR